MRVFVPMVSQADLMGVPALRPIKATLEAAKELLDGERVRGAQTALKWVDEFGGAIARAGDLVYEVMPADLEL